jgi:hypothetical protein
MEKVAKRAVFSSNPAWLNFVFQSSYSLYNKITNKSYTKIFVDQKFTALIPQNNSVIIKTHDINNGFRKSGRRNNGSKDNSSSGCSAEISSISLST